MDDLTSEFVAETRETLERVGASLVAWEADPADAARLDEIFRFVHTVKGSCGFLDLGRIGAFAHAAESALAEVRDGKRAPTPALVGAMLRLIDRIALLSEALESGAKVPDEAGDTALIAALDGQSEIVAVPEAAQRGARSIRVSVDLLETLMNQVSDLVLARNDLARRLREGDDSELALERLSATVADVRDSVTRTRMQPIEKLFATLPRLARDTAAATGKDVRLKIEGGDVEIDREMVELIRDPLTHIVRNAIDHGIEAPDARRAAGKMSTGTLRIAARQSGNQVSIQIDDDGRGVDVAVLKARAIAAKLIDADAAGVLSDEAALQLMFAPGLSTATEVTAVSGRGVGMDVARDNIERLGGTISLANRPGRGLTITLRAPLTLSIMSAIVVEAGGQMFAVPRAAIEEIVAADSAAVRVERVGDGRLAVVRGALLTVVPLGGALGLVDADPVRLVIVDPPGGCRFALGVDRVCENEELVVRPIAPGLAALGAYAGMALAEGGAPLLLLDVLGIAARAGLERESAPVNAASIVPIGRERSMLTFRALDGKIRAIRAASVERIEDAGCEDFTSVGGQTFVRLDGALHSARIDGALPVKGPIALIRVATPDGVIGYPVAVLMDLAPIGPVTKVDADGVEGLVLIDGVPSELVHTDAAGPVKRKRLA